MIQIILKVINSILLIKVFGVSIESDAYLLGMSSISVLLIIATLPSGLFIPYYNDLKIKSIEEAHKFYNSSILFSFVFGSLCYIIVNILISFIVQLFAFHIDMERLNLFKQILQILSLQLVFYPVNQINEQLFNAEMKFSLPYILACIPTFCIVITQIVMMCYNSNNVIYLAVIQSLGVFMIALIGIVYISGTMIKICFTKLHYMLREQVKSSIILKIGDIGWGIALPILFNNFLATFPKGYISIFYYAKQMIDAVSSFTIGPSLQILQSKISQLLTVRDKKSIEKLYKPFIKYGLCIFVFMLTITYFVQTPILKLITNNLTSNDLKMIALIFLSLCSWYIIIFLEKSYLVIVHMSKKAKETFYINMIFFAIFTPLIFILKNIFGIYAIGATATLAQLSNFILYRKIAIRELDRMKNEEGN